MNDNFISFDVVVDDKTITSWVSMEVDDNGQWKLTTLPPEGHKLYLINF